METIFVKSIKQAGPAHLAGLQTGKLQVRFTMLLISATINDFYLQFLYSFLVGDRILSVNGCSVEKLSYADVVKLIQLTRDCLDLVVVSKQDDVLQTVSILTLYNIEILFLSSPFCT